jgi:hypothetical protein
LEALRLAGLAIHGGDETLGAEFLVGAGLQQPQPGDALEIAGPQQTGILDLKTRGQRVIDQQTGRAGLVGGHSN